MGRGGRTHRRTQPGRRPKRATSGPLHTAEEIRAKINAEGDTRYTIVGGFFRPEQIADPAIAELWAKVLGDRGTVGDLVEIERLVGLRDASGVWRGPDEGLAVTRPKPGTRGRRPRGPGASRRRSYTNEDIRAKIEWEGETLYTIVEGFFKPADIADPAVAELWTMVLEGRGTAADIAEIERLVGLV